QIVAVRLQVEEDARALVEGAAEELEADGDLAVLEIVDAGRHGVREVGEGLDVVDELFVAGAIDGTRLVRQAAGRLAALPLPAVDEEDLLTGVGGNRPVADDRQEVGGLGSFFFGRQIDFDRLRGERREAEGKHQNGQNGFLHNDLLRRRKKARSTVSGQATKNRGTAPRGAACNG